MTIIWQYLILAFCLFQLLIGCWNTFSMWRVEARISALFELLPRSRASAQTRRYSNLQRRTTGPVEPKPRPSIRDRIPNPANDNAED